MSWKDTVPNRNPTLSRGGGEGKVATNRDNKEYRNHTGKDSLQFDAMKGAKRVRTL